MKNNVSLDSSERAIVNSALWHFNWVDPIAGNLEAFDQMAGSGQLLEMAARLTVVLDGTAVSVPDAIALLWSKPSWSEP